MLTKKQFIERLNFIKEYQEKMNTFDKALKEFAHSDFTGFYDENIYAHLLNNLIEDMDDKYDTISWWICETDWGKEEEMTAIWEKDDPDDKPTWNIKTPEDLYAYLFVNNAKAPSESSYALAIKAQDNGVKYTLKTLETMRYNNEEAHNKGWEERGALIRYALEKIENEYRMSRGGEADLDYSKFVEIISVLDDENWEAE